MLPQGSENRALSAAMVQVALPRQAPDNTAAEVAEWHPPTENPVAHDPCGVP